MTGPGSSASRTKAAYAALSRLNSGQRHTASKVSPYRSSTSGGLARLAGRVTGCGSSGSDTVGSGRGTPHRHVRRCGPTGPNA